MYRYFILALVAAVAPSSNAKCPDVKPVNNFNLQAYGNGVWYEVSRFPHKVETGGNCGTATYKLEGEGFSIINTDVANKKLRTIGGSAKLAEDAGNTGKMIFTYPYGAGGVNINVVLWILDTDYKNYSVAYYCQYDEKTGSRQDHAWVLSRTKKLNSDAKANVEKILSESTFLDSSKLVWPDFSDEACKVEA